MKKFLALLLCLSMILTLMPAVFATETTPTEDVTTQAETTAETTAATVAATETTAATTEATEETTVETTVETTEATEETTEATEEITEETTEETEETTEPTEPTEGDTITTFTMPDGSRVKVDDIVYIKPGQTIYKEASEDAKSYTLSMATFRIQITEMIPDATGTVTWYKFEYKPESLIDGALSLIFAQYKYVKVSSTSVTDPSDEEALVKEIQETMTAFVDTVGELPEADAVTAFDEAEQHYADIYAMADRDSIISPDETEKYSVAYRAFAEVMGYDEDKEVSYPGTDLIDDLRNGVTSALELLDEAEEKYATLNGTSTVATFAAEDTTGTGSVVDMNETYATAKAKLDAILEAKPDLLEYEVEAVASTDHKVASVAENIQMNLFNYGPAINTQQSGQGFMRFTHSEGTYGWAVDSAGDAPAEGSGGWPTLYKTLNNSRLFPTIEKGNDVLKTGTLQYLFDSTYKTGRVEYETYKNNISSRGSGNSTVYNYHSIYFPVKNDDGSGTGLFQKEGDYFVYDSAKNAAWYNPSTQKFEIYDYVLRPAYTEYGDSVRSGNFLPFNQGHTQGREDYQTETKEKTWTFDGKEYKSTVAKTDNVPTKPANASVTAYRLWGNSSNTEVDLWFGVDFEFDFYQPVGGKKNNEPMVFEFLGDDDVFVYIDDVLILDIGGTHAAQTGTINFATGRVTNPSGFGQYGTSGNENSTIYALMKGALGSSLDESQFVDTNGDGTPDTFKDYTMHNLKFYYLERGGNISYCKLKFNMDPLPTGSVTLQKQVNGINNALADDQTYTFKVTAKDANNATVNGMTYQITENGQNGGNVNTVNSGGIISLKANQMATFTDLKAGTTITFTETASDTTSGTKWTVNGVEKSEGSVTTTIGESKASVRFVCTNTRKTSTLTIEKKVDGDVWEQNDQFEICVKIGDKLYTGTATGANNRTVQFKDGKAMISKDEKITISQIPSGMSYEVTESQHNGGKGYQYEAPKYTANTGTIQHNETTAVTITNTLKLLYGELVIQKTGIDSRDHYGVGYGPDGETQSTVYTIKGTSDSGVAIDMQVVITGNGSMTIKDIPVGKYTVTENMDWAWRYENSQNVHSNVEIKGGATTTESFNNTRTKHYWLSGDAYCKNQWK